MKEECKKKYLPPVLSVELIEMEQGIAAGSTISPGGNKGIEVQPWEEGGNAGSGESEGEWWN